MNLMPLYRNHPDLAEVLHGPQEYVVRCHDCGLRFPLREIYALDGKGTPGCGPCADRRQDAALAEWWERLAKEGREGA